MEVFVLASCIALRNRLNEQVLGTIFNLVLFNIVPSLPAVNTENPDFSSALNVFVS